MDRHAGKVVHTLKYRSLVYTEPHPSVSEYTDLQMAFPAFGNCYYFNFTPALYHKDNNKIINNQIWCKIQEFLGWLFSEMFLPFFLGGISTELLQPRHYRILYLWTPLSPSYPDYLPSECALRSPPEDIVTSTELYTGWLRIILLKTMVQEECKVL